MGRLGAAGAGADVAGFGDVEDGGGVAAVDRARGGDCRVQISRTSGDLTSTGYLHGRTQGRRGAKRYLHRTGPSGMHTTRPSAARSTASSGDSVTMSPGRCSLLP